MFEDLYAIDWQNVNDCFGTPATAVPKLIQELFSEDDTIRAAAIDTLHLCLTFHTMLMSPAAEQVFPIVLDLLNDPNAPSATALVALLDVINCLLATAITESFHDRQQNFMAANRLYDTIRQAQAVFIQFANHPAATVNAKAMEILFSFKPADRGPLLGWWVERIQHEPDLKFKAQQLQRVAAYYADDIGLNLYRTWLLEQANKLLSSKNKWVQLNAARTILRLNLEQTDALIEDLLLDLLSEATYQSLIAAGFSDADLGDFVEAAWDLAWLGTERRIQCSLKLLERGPAPITFVHLIPHLVHKVFPQHPPTEFSAVQKRVLKSLADTLAVWKDEPCVLFSRYGLPTTRVEMQKLVTW